MSLKYEPSSEQVGSKYAKAKSEANGNDTPPNAPNGGEEHLSSDENTVRPCPSVTSLTFS